MRAVKCEPNSCQQQKPNRPCVHFSNRSQPTCLIGASARPRNSPCAGLWVVSHRDFLEGPYSIAPDTVARYAPSHLVVAVDPVNFEKPYTHQPEGVSTVMKSTLPALDDDDLRSGCNAVGNDCRPRILTNTRMASRCTAMTYALHAAPVENGHETH